MSKRYTIIALIVLAIVGSLFNAQATNMLMSDMANKSANPEFNTLFCSLGAATVAVSYVIGAIFIVRYYLRPQYAKRMTTVYLFIFSALGLIGTVSIIVNSAAYYHSFVSPYPFPGYTIIFFILNVFLLCGPMACYFLHIRKMESDQEQFKMNWKYVLKTAGYFLFICLAFNRFGMLLGSPVYIYLRNLYKTFPFYIFLAVPMFILVVKVLTYLEVIKTRKMKIILTSVGIALTLVLAGAYMIIGMKDSGVVSAISPALPLERLATLPIETIIHVVACLAMTIPALIIFIRNKEEA